MDQLGVRKGAWTEEEDLQLRKCIEKYGEGKWALVPLRAGLNRCHKSCRLRWLNYLRPNIKRGQFNEDEIDLIIRLHRLLGNRWSLIAGRIPGRTANDIKNYWNCHLSKKLIAYGIDKKEKQKENGNHEIIKPQPRKLALKLTSKVVQEASRSQRIEDKSGYLHAAFDGEDDDKWWEDLLTERDEMGRSDILWTTSNETDDWNACLLEFNLWS